MGHGLLSIQGFNVFGTSSLHITPSHAPVGLPVAPPSSKNLRTSDRYTTIQVPSLEGATLITRPSVCISVPREFPRDEDYFRPVCYRCTQNEETREGGEERSEVFRIQERRLERFARESTLASGVVDYKKSARQPEVIRRLPFT
jgi:hypothetical protein